MNRKITITPRWYGTVPTRNGKELPMNQWARAGRKRRWMVRWRTLDGKRPGKTFEAKGDAEDFARTMTAEFERNPQTRTKPKRIKIGQLKNELSSLRIGPSGQRLSKGSLDCYNEVMTSFIDFTGEHIQLESITPSTMTRYFAHLANKKSRRNKPLSTATINKHKRTLKAMFNVAIRQLNYIHVNPLSNIKQDKELDKELRIVDVIQYTALNDACDKLPVKGLWWKAFVTCAYTGGLRANEITHLTWADIDFENETIRVAAKPESKLEAWRPKGVKGRIVPIPTGAINILSKLLDASDEGSGYVFISPDRVAWITQQRKLGKWNEGQDVINNLTRDFQVLIGKAKIARATIHDLRRSCITHWVKSLTAVVVNELAGHVDIKTTLKYYVSLRPEDLSEAREVSANAMLLDTNWTQTGK